MEFADFEWSDIQHSDETWMLPLVGKFEYGSPRQNYTSDLILAGFKIQDKLSVDGLYGVRAPDGWFLAQDKHNPHIWVCFDHRGKQRFRTIAAPGRSNYQTDYFLGDVDLTNLPSLGEGYIRVRPQYASRNALIEYVSHDQALIVQQQQQLKRLTTAVAEMACARMAWNQGEQSDYSDSFIAGWNSCMNLFGGLFGVTTTVKGEEG